MSENKIEIYIDGACSGNPGKGGYGIVVIMPTGDKFEVSEFLKSTTNNQAELLAAIASLNLLPDSAVGIKIVIHSDSNYVIKGINEWIYEWQENDWITKRGSVKYKTLWLKMQKLAQKFDIDWVWIKGHSDNEYNNLADKLAKEAIKNEKGSGSQE